MPSLPLHGCIIGIISRSGTNIRRSILGFPAGKLAIHLLCSRKVFPNRSLRDFRPHARRKSVKKLTDGPLQDAKTLEMADQNLVERDEVLPDTSASEESTSNIIPSRRDVLQACTVTSGLMAGCLGCVNSTVGIEMWHLELIIGSVILISSCRYLLLKTWPDFAESTEAANKQVLTSLLPQEYIVVSLLPGVSEELLFRGALLPLLGMDWKSVLAVASLFGILHLGNGRNYSFAIWATFVGFVYGYATVASSSIIVPMASHALNNLVGGILWRQRSKWLE